MKYFAVIGNPIYHSKSPEIHNAFASQFDINLQYERQLVEVGNFSAFATKFFDHAHGANITLPFKEDAVGFADELSEDAKISGAVNTLSRNNKGIIVGDNTDGIGLVKDICCNHEVSFHKKMVLIIGAGGASRGVILAIAKENPHSITIVNRTKEKAEQLAKQFRSQANIFVNTFAMLSNPFDIIINATSTGLCGSSLPLSNNIFTDNSFAYDMMYAIKPTPFMYFAKKCGAKTADGLGMLVEQAAKSFEIWHGVKPKTQNITDSIRKILMQ